MASVENEIQIAASKDELMRRIDVFMLLKKKQVDISNQFEFTGSHDQLNSDEDTCTCARVDSNRITRGHIQVRKVCNVEGPSNNLPKPEQQLWASLVMLDNKAQSSRWKKE